MKILAVESSSSMGNIALFDSESGNMMERELTPGFSHGRELVPAVESLLSEYRLSSPDLIAGGQGPGSYTGLRIGLAVIRALAFAWECPTLGISSLEALAHGIPHENRHVLVTVDAKKGEVYWALYHLTEGRPRCVREPRVGKPWDIGGLPDDTIIVGDGSDVVSSVPNYARYETIADRVPRAADVARLAWRDHLAGVQQEVELLLPVYLRPSEAEIRWSKRKPKNEQSGV